MRSSVSGNGITVKEKPLNNAIQGIYCESNDPAAALIGFDDCLMKLMRTSFRYTLKSGKSVAPLGGRLRFIGDNGK